MRPPRAVSFADMEPAESKALFERLGAPKYRAAQAFSWIGRGAVSFDEMTDLPAPLRASLARETRVGIPSIIETRRSAVDGTAKFAMVTDDGAVLECALMSYNHGRTLCVSSQAGCRMGCAFCASKESGFLRNLSAGEMYGQLAAVRRALGENVGHIVVMGVGEPFDNTENLFKFFRLLKAHAPPIGARKVTVSTCGLIPGIKRLAQEFPQVGLSVSLHAADDATRAALMPVSRLYSIDILLDTCKMYTDSARRRVTYEYALFEGVNDAPKDARLLASRLIGDLCHVNLIPANPVDGTGLKPSSKSSADCFLRILRDRGIAATVRRSLGGDIEAACGQLRNKWDLS